MRTVFVLALCFVASSALGAPKRQKRVTKLDRMKAIGAPVLEADAKSGIYVWLEDGWFRFAAVGKGKRQSRLRVTVNSSKPIKADPLDFRTVMSGGNRVTIEARVKEVPARGRIKTDGNIVVTSPHPVFVGPLSRRAVNGVKIGRY